jgi:hypothetical protein
LNNFSENSFLILSSSYFMPWCRICKKTYCWHLRREEEEKRRN